MSQTRKFQTPVITVRQFDTFLESQQDDSLWELIDGEILAMTNPTVRHEQIAGNIGVPLNVAMRQTGCHVYQGGLGVQSSDDEEGRYKPRPDVLVHCGPVHGERTYVSDPLVIIEVLSPGTINRDRGSKLRFYQTGLATLRHIALIYQDQMRVEHYRRTEHGWELEVLTAPDAVLSFEAVAFDVKLRAVYEGVTLDVPTREPTDLA